MKKITKWICLLLVLAMPLNAFALSMMRVNPDEYQRFSLEVASQYLREEKADNQILSPLSLYLALSMLAEGAEGQTLADLKRVLNLPEGRDIGDISNVLRHSVTFSTSKSTLQPANSLWLNEALQVEKDFVDKLKYNHGAEVFSEDFANPATGDKISRWISDKTKGLIDMKITPTPANMLLLINALYFQDAWEEPFDKELTTPDKFHLPSGGEKYNVPMMQRFEEETVYNEGDTFYRAKLPLQSGGWVSFVLPKEGVTPAMLAATGDSLKEALEGGQEKEANISWKMPRIDMKNTIMMNEMLEDMGLQSLFEGADLSGIAKGAFVSKVQQDNRIILDEKEVKAASVTIIDVCMAVPMPDLEIFNMHLDRPYLMAIYARSGELCFVAAVNNP